MVRFAQVSLHLYSTIGKRGTESPNLALLTEVENQSTVDQHDNMLRAKNSSEGSKPGRNSMVNGKDTLVYNFIALSLSHFSMV